MSEHETKVRRGPRYRAPANGKIRTISSAPSLIDAEFFCTLAGSELTAACGGGKKVALACGVDERTGRRWVAGDPANPLNKMVRAILDGTDPWRVVALAGALATLAELTKAGPLTEERWRAAYLEAHRSECLPDGVEDVVTTDLLTGRASLEQQSQADSRHVSALLRRIALGWIGQQFGYSLQTERAN